MGWSFACIAVASNSLTNCQDLNMRNCVLEQENTNLYKDVTLLWRSRLTSVMLNEDIYPYTLIMNPQINEVFATLELFCCKSNQNQARGELNLKLYQNNIG